MLPGLERFKASTISLGNLFQCLITRIIKFFFPISTHFHSLNLDFALDAFSLKPSPLILVQSHEAGSHFPAFKPLFVRTGEAVHPQLPAPRVPQGMLGAAEP